MDVLGVGCLLVVSKSFVTPWTVACQAPLSMRFPRQECWSGLPFPSPGDLPNLCLVLGRYILHHWATWEAQNMENCSPYRTGLLYMGENLFGTFYSFIDVWSFYHYKTFNAAYSVTPSIAIKEICPPLLHFFMNTEVIVDEHYQCHQWYVSIMHRNLFSLCSKKWLRRAWIPINSHKSRALVFPHTHARPLNCFQWTWALYNRVIWNNRMIKNTVFNYKKNDKNN